MAGVVPAWFERWCGNAEPVQHCVNEVDAVDFAVAAVRAESVAHSDKISAIGH